MFCLVFFVYGFIVDKIKCCLILKSCNNLYVNSKFLIRICNGIL